jgi:hypothetical protein
MVIRDIPREEWRDELDSFSRRHEGWIVSITTRQPEGQVAIEAHDLPLLAVRPSSPRASDIAIVVGDRQHRLTHQVRDPAALRLELTADEAPRALIIDGSDGATTTVAFRSPMRPEEVDGFADIHRA